MFKKSASLAIAATITLTFTATVSEAGRYKRSYNEGSYVVAESDFGNGRVSSRVRHTRVGRQVQLPGGNWVYCARSCAETLRVETVDFWQSEKGAGVGNESTHDGGVFGKLRLNFGHRR